METYKYLGGKQELRINSFIKTIRDSFIGSVEVYTEGSCYQFYKILKEVFPEAECYYDCDHVITKIGDKFWDITGEVSLGKHLKVEEGSFEHQKLNYLIYKIRKYKNYTKNN